MLPDLPEFLHADDVVFLLLQELLLLFLQLFLYVPDGSFFPDADVNLFHYGQSGCYARCVQNGRGDY